MSWSKRLRESALVSPEFWIAAGERAIKTAGQVASLALIVGLVAGRVEYAEAEVINAWLIDFKTLGGVALGGAILSLLTSLASLPVGHSGPSLANEVAVPKL